MVATHLAAARRARGPSTGRILMRILMRIPMCIPIRIPIRILILLACVVPGRGVQPSELRLLAPLALPEARRPVTAATGDFNGDGKRDLVTAAGDGSIDVLLQDPASREAWTRVPLSAGTGTYVVAAGDLDGDGLDELLAADPGTATYVFRNDGGAFGEPEALAPRLTRWVTLGDWNGDGHLDAATSSFDQQLLTILLGDGSGELRPLRSISLRNPHVAVALDHDGDGRLDLLVGHGNEGIRVLEGRGDGTFVTHAIDQGFPLCGRLLFPADFDGDGRGDVASSCVLGAGQGPALIVGLARGMGAYEPTLSIPREADMTAAAADWTGDGRADLIVVSPDSASMTFLEGKGDGTFLPERTFGTTGAGPSYAVGDDLDGDGLTDAVVTAQGAPGATIFWGASAGSIFHAGSILRGLGGSPATLGDFDGDDILDIISPRSTPPGAVIALGPLRGGEPRATLDVPLEASYNDALAADLNGDGTLDLAGVSYSSLSLHVAYLTSAGAVLREVTYTLGTVPRGLAVGLLDDDALPDLALRRIALDDVAIFRNTGDGFEAMEPVPTVPTPRDLLVGDIDADGRTDLVVGGNGVIAVHHAEGGGRFAGPAEALRTEAARAFAAIALGDVLGDGRLELLAAAPGRSELLIVSGAGGRAFAEPLAVALRSASTSIALADLDEDGRLDISLTRSGGGVTWIRSGGPAGLAGAEDLEASFPASLAHALADVTGDGVEDGVFFAAGAVHVLPGAREDAAPGTLLRRGDADLDGKVSITDAVALLAHLFQGGAATCPKASDANDDGALNLTDALAILGWLFRGGPPPSPPGPAVCGEDPTPDGLEGCAACR